MSDVIARAKALAEKNLKQYSEELLYWRRRGVLPETSTIRELEAICEEIDAHSATRMAEDFVVNAALEKVARD